MGTVRRFCLSLHCGAKALCGDVGRLFSNELLGLKSVGDICDVLEGSGKDGFCSLRFSVDCPTAEVSIVIVRALALLVGAPPLPACSAMLQVLVWVNESIGL